MRWLRSVRVRLRSMLYQTRADQELDAELDFYVEQRTRDYVAQGMAPEEARATARRSLGSVTLVREHVRESRGLSFLTFVDECRQHVRGAVRTFARRPGVTFAIVLTVALGVGANTAVLSLVQAVLLKPLPFPDGDRVVAAWFTPENQPDQRAGTNTFAYFTIRDHTQAFESVGAVRLSNAFNVGDDDPNAPGRLRVPAQWFSFGMIDVLETSPVLGRWPTPADETAIVISHRLWQNLYGGREDILGRKLRVENFPPAEIVGVMPQGFELMEPSDLWLFQTDEDLSVSMRSERRIFTVVARMKPAITVAQAQDEMNRTAVTLAREMPESHNGWTIRVQPLRDVAVGAVRTPLLVFQGAVLLVLLLACANVAGLLIAHGSTRRQELAVRAAIGARRGHLVRQLLTESVLLALLGGVVGVVLAWSGLQLFAGVSSLTLATADLSPGPMVLTVTLAMTTGSGVLFGILPAVSWSRPNVMGALRDTMHGSTEGAARHRLRATLVVVQVALAMVLLAGAGLMVNSFLRLTQVDPGFDAEHLISFHVPLSRSFYAPAKTVPFDVELGSRIDDLTEAIRQRLAVVPGVQSATLAVTAPLGAEPFETRFSEVGKPLTASEAQAWFGEWYPVGANYFETLRIPLVRGRLFTSRDLVGGPPVAIVNEAMAQMFWPGADVIGKVIQIDLPYDQPREIVGIVSDVHQDLYQTRGVPQLYVPRPQLPRQMNMVTAQRIMLANTFVVRTTGDPSQSVPALRAALTEVDATQVMAEVNTIEDYGARQLDGTRETSVVLALFGVMAVLLAVVGVYGIVAQMLGQRRREIGIRIALGAQTGAVRRLVMRQGLLLVIAGMGLGLIGAFAVTRALGSLLWRVSATDPLTYAIVLLTILAVGAAACLLPARRASRIDPLLVIRE
jgi:putative ABC transport system permease protein